MALAERPCRTALIQEDLRATLAPAAARPYNKPELLVTSPDGDDRIPTAFDICLPREAVRPGMVVGEHRESSQIGEGRGGAR
jgi:hypothetical protein